MPNELSKLKRLKIFICGGDWNVKKSKIIQEGWGITNISVISLLSDLTILNISNNNVREVGEIYKLKKLQKIYLNNNKITSFPDISSLKYLSNLYLSNNKITNVEFLREAFSLKTVDLHSNDISDLTPLKELISKIGIADSRWTEKTINITSNPLQIPRPEVISQGKEKVLAYFNQLEAEKDIKLPPFINKDIKLIVVGNSSVGKSTLLHWLKFREVKKDIPTTHWMIVDKWETKFKKKEYTIRIFDFGGQEYYHDTHHLFFTNNTGYLVLWDSKTDGFDQKEIEQIQDGGITKKVEIQTFPLSYWLDSINFQTKRKNKTEDEKEIKKILDERDKAIESSVKSGEEWTKHVTASVESIKQAIKGEENILVIQNKVDNIGQKTFIDEKSAKENHEKIFDFLAISIWEERGLVNFEESLFQVLDTIPMVGKEFLGTWGKIKNKIESESEIFEKPFSVDDFRKYCNTIISKLPQVKDKNKSQINKVLFSKQDAQSFAQYLNDIGILLYFPENIDLSGKIFINQAQVLKNIYDALKGLEKSQGQFNVENIVQNLGKAVADEEVSETIKLMLHFKIIFQHPSQKDSYIAPLYLPKEPMKSIKIFEILFHKPVYRYEYKSFIYKNVILAFFSSYGKKALKESDITENYYYWKDGIILKDEKTEEIIMVKFFPAKRDMSIAYIDVYKLNGSNSDSFLNQVIQDLDDINQDWGIIKAVPSKGNDFIPLSIIHDNEKLNNWVFHYKGKVYNLVDFKKHLNTQLKMKKVFISYSKADANHLAKLENHLSVMKRNGTIATWNCRKLLPGEKWDGKIKKELEDADLILFLVSDDFLATDYIWDIEIKRAIERDNDPNDSVRVIPIIVRACDWEESPLGVFNTAPKKAEVINSADDIDVAWTSVVKDLKKVL